jgi:hypothetical protein
MFCYVQVSGRQFRFEKNLNIKTPQKCWSKYATDVVYIYRTRQLFFGLYWT